VRNIKWSENSPLAQIYTHENVWPLIIINEIQLKATPGTDLVGGRFGAHRPLLWGH